MTAINRDISEIQLRGTIATTLANVRNAYWELLYALEAVEVARGSLTLAEKLVEDNQTRVEIGTMAPLDVVQAAGRSGHPASGGGAGRSHMAHRGALSQAPDRQRHRRSPLACVDQSGRSSCLCARSRSTSRARCAKRCRTGRIWQQARRQIQANDTTHAVHAEPDASESRPHRRPMARRVSAARSSSVKEAGLAAPSSAPFPAGIRTRFARSRA